MRRAKKKLTIPVDSFPLSTGGSAMDYHAESDTPLPEPARTPSLINDSLQDSTTRRQGVNTESRILCAITVDESGSTQPYIEEASKSLVQFKEDCLKDRLLRLQLEFAVVAFSDSARTVNEFG